jgi:diaminohydroxyphosphoribosylaminopyrimidine deaminase/5-amino-6-(5-phosphoribosylamino)uracil reductase
MALTDHDRTRMQRAIALARMGRFEVDPNPPVGCVIDGPDGAGTVGESWHKAYGGPHAEIEALRIAGERARGGTAYVSLEPCCHAGKTGPCADALIRAGIGRVVFGTRDPNPEVAGQGLERLLAAGIEVDGPTCGEDAQALLVRFRHALARERPYVIAKWAISLDGASSPARGRGGAISGRKAMLRTHALRGRVDAVLVGVGTVLADDPDLRCRLVDGPPDGRAQPLRVVLDSELRTPPTGRLVRSADQSPVLLFASKGADASRADALQQPGVSIERVPGGERGLALETVLEALATRGVRRLLIEGGARVHGAFFRQGFVDHVQAYVAPSILGGSTAVPGVTGSGIDSAAAALALEEIAWRKLGDDLMLQGYVPLRNDEHPA